MTFLCENLTPKVKKLNLEGCRTTLTNDNVLQLVSNDITVSLHFENVSKQLYEYDNKQQSCLQNQFK